MGTIHFKKWTKENVRNFPFVKVFFLWYDCIERIEEGIQ